QAIINRMGFNNEGVDRFVAQLQRSRYSGIKGVNIGKNFDTPLERASDDYLLCYEKVYPHADYIVVNVSSPNTQGLRELQRPENLNRIVERLEEKRLKLAEEFQKRVPLLVKLSPDLSEEDLVATTNAIKSLPVDGVVATNTTISRDAIADSPLS